MRRAGGAGGGTTSEPIWLQRIVERTGYRVAGPRFLAGPGVGDAVAVASALREAGVGVAFLPLLPVPRRDADLWSLEAALAELIRSAAWRGIEPHLVLDVTLVVGTVGGSRRDAGFASLSRVVEAAAARGGFIHLCLPGEGILSDVLALGRAKPAGGRPAVGVSLSLRLAHVCRRVLSEARAGFAVLLHDYERTLAERPLSDEAEAGGAGAMRPRFVALARDVWARAASVTALSRDTATLDALERAAAEAGAAGRFEVLYRLGDRVAHLLRSRDAGRAVRVLVPFGPEWAPYLTARLAEWPWDAGARAARR